MLSLRLKSGEYLTIGDNIAVQVFRQRGDNIEVAIKAPREISVLRGQLLERAEERPEGLRQPDYKRAAEREHNAENLRKLAARRENRADALKSMGEILDEIEAKSPELRDKVYAMRKQLSVLEGKVAHSTAH